jgi:hypothetical protein
MVEIIMHKRILVWKPERKSPLRELDVAGRIMLR